MRGGKRLLRDSPNFKGMPAEPMDADSLRAKFDVLTRDLGDSASAALYELYAQL